MPPNNENSLIKVRFSIGAKLITIITFIVLMSLGFIIAFASLLMRADLRIMAEESNFEANRISAMTAETTLENTLSNSMILMRTIAAIGSNSILAHDTAEFFFERNPMIISVFFSYGGRELNLINENHDFISSISSSDADAEFTNAYRTQYSNELRRAGAGETILINAAPYFNAPVLALFFPLDYGNAVTGGAVLFAPVNLSESFGYGVNKSYLLNDAGDILIHSDINKVQTAENTRDHDFTQYIWGSMDASAQTLYTEDDGSRYLGAFTKINTAGAVVVTSIEYNKIFEGIDATTRRNIYLTITVLSISIILIWFFAKSISIPIKALAVAAHQIETGSFEVALQPRGRDEIGVLTASFQRMSKALGIFGRFTNREIALRAMRGEIKPGGLPKKATVFFSDIRDFTSISENFTNIFGDDASNRIVHWLNGYLTRMVECIEKTNGVVDKFIGDAVMAHWGTVYTTGSTKKDACYCVETALAMRSALMQINKLRDTADPGSPRIKIGCGINTGIVTAGQLGSDVRMEYTVIGDPVNLASRVESLNKTFGTDILITENTWKLVRRHFITEEMPPIKVKGKAKSVRVFAVINRVRNPKGPKTLVKLRRMLGINDPGNLKMIETGSAGKKKIKYRFIKK